MNFSKLKGLCAKLQIVALVLMSGLLASCGGSTTAADIPDNFTGSYSGTVGADAANLTILQSQGGQTTTTGTDGSTTPATTGAQQSFSGSISIRTEDDCTYSISLDSGALSANGISLSGEDISVSLVRNGRQLTGSVTYTGSPADRDGGEDEEEGDCELPSGGAIFQ